MEKPGRQELQQTYEDLADEVLIGIARNVDQEYEDVAVETAHAVLEKRGVDVPDSDGAVKDCSHHHGFSSCSASAGLNRANKKLSGPIVEVPKFSAGETHDIEEIFVGNNIPCEIHPVAGKSCSSCRDEEYVFHVPEESFAFAIKLVKDYYAEIAQESSSRYFSGECPACGTRVVNVKECSDCGLSLVVDYSESLARHPFMSFLKQNNLLSQ